jgi:hypothetical protein
MRRHASLVIALLTLVVTVVATAPASSHPAPFLHWGADRDVNWAFTPEVDALPGMRARVQDAAFVWNNVNRGMRFVQNPDHADFASTAPCPGGVDQNNDAIHYEPLTGAEAGWLAATRSCWNATTGELWRFEIVVDRNDPFYTGGGTPPGNQYDLWSVLSHEFGHATGLEHWDDANPMCSDGGIVRHTMCPTIPIGETWMRTVEPHDIHTFHNTYGGETFCGIVAYGAIRGKYVAPPAGVNFGCPTVEEHDQLRYGRRQVFQGGQILWHPATGAHEVHGSILGEFDARGGAGGVLGYPVTDESGPIRNGGTFNHFNNLTDPTTCAAQGAPNSTGSIYWTPATGAHEVHGSIRSEWCAIGWENSAPGYPVTEERGTPDGRGRYNHFNNLIEPTTCGAQGAPSSTGSIYWTPTTGAHEVHGVIRARWCAMGWETSSLKYPVTDEFGGNSLVNGPYRANFFENGAICYYTRTGTILVPPLRSCP